MKATLRPSLVWYYHTTLENPTDRRVAALERLRTFRCERSNIANRRKPAVVKAETADPSVASRAQKEAPGAVGKAPVREPYFTLKLDCAKPDPDARHIGGYLAFGPKPRNVGRDRKAFQHQPVRHDAHDITPPHDSGTTG
jgi:hypothetical protein